MQIYWIEDKQRRGPATVPDVLSMVRLGELSPDTPGWHSGVHGWRPLRELPALADFLEQPPAPEQLEPDTAQLPPIPPMGADPTVLSVAVPAPLLRFMARMLDTALYASLLLGGMHLLGVPYVRSFQPGSLFFWLPMILAEALMLKCFGCTIGKFWLGIRLQSVSRPLSLPRALARSLLVFTLGMGCMHPIAALITLSLAYFSATRRGLTFWDMHTGAIPTLRAPVSRAKLFIAGMLIFCSFQFCSLCMQPWLPDMMRDLEEQSPQAAQMLQEWMQNTP